MKKSIFLSALAVLAAAAVSVFVYMKNENPMDELFNANVEALASGESGYSCTACTICDTFGSYVECTGAQSCSRNFRSVTCDGKTTYC